MTNRLILNLKTSDCNFMQKSFAVALLALFSLSMEGQQNMTLAQMVNRALEANYDIRVQRNGQAQAENSNTIGNAGFLPQADITAEKNYAITNSQQQFVSGDSQQATAARNEATSAQASVRWVVFDGLAMFARKDRLSQLALLGKTNTRYYIEQTAADLAIAYFQLKQERKLLETFQKTLAVSKSRLGLQEKGLEVGARNMLDVQRARVDRNADSAMVLSQTARIQELEIQINRIINQDLETAINAVDSFNLARALSLEELLEKAGKENARLTQQQLQELIANEEVKIVRGALFPELELFGNYNYGQQQNEVGFLQSSRSFGPNFGVRVRFNLFSGGQQHIAVENAKIEAATAGLRTEQAGQEIQAAVRVAYLRWKNEIKQVRLEEQSVGAADQTLEIATKQYELGVINDVEFRLIQLSTVNAQTRYLQAQFRAKSREIELYRLSGQLMEKIM